MYFSLKYETNDWLKKDRVVTFLYKITKHKKK